MHQTTALTFRGMIVVHKEVAVIEAIAEIGAAIQGRSSRVRTPSCRRQTMRHGVRPHCLARYRMLHRTAAVTNLDVEINHRKHSKARVVATRRATRTHTGRLAYLDLP